MNGAWSGAFVPDRSGALAVSIALAVDWVLGEPPASWHPVVWMGRALSSTGAPWPASSSRVAFVRGMGAWLAGAALAVAAAALALAAISFATRHSSPPAAMIIDAAVVGLLLKPLLSWRLLHDEVAAVEQALSMSLEAGRERLKYLVSRPTGSLTAAEVRESALESLAENLNDSVVAPLFWFVLGGLPAAALYRFANTADAMWGYRGRFEWAGKWSARADDVLSYVPARLTALAIAMAARRWPRGVRREARVTPSPNGGWPMAMMALALGIRLSKPGVYVLHPEGRLARADDMRCGLRLGAHAVWVAAAVAIIVLAAASRRQLA